VADLMKRVQARAGTRPLGRCDDTGALDEIGDVSNRIRRSGIEPRPARSRAR